MIEMSILFCLKVEAVCCFVSVYKQQKDHLLLLLLSHFSRVRLCVTP